jgi:hypothetical protein
MVAALVVAAVLAGCGGDAVKAARPAKVANPPDEAIAASIGQHGSRLAILAAPDVATLVNVIFATIGLDATERACAAPAAVASLQPDEEGRLPVSSMGKMVSRFNQETSSVAKAISGCSTPASIARQAAKQPAPDRDLTGLIEVGTRLSIAEATAVGFTEVEAQCFADALLGSADAAAVAAAISGTATSLPVDPKGAVRKCLTPQRQAALAVQARQDDQTFRDCRKRQDIEVQKMIAEASSSSTTTTEANQTTTTFLKCA